MTLAPFRLAPSRFLINLRLISNPSAPSERAKGRWERREYIKRHSELQITNCNLIPRARTGGAFPQGRGRNLSLVRRQFGDGLATSVLEGREGYIVRERLGTTYYAIQVSTLAAFEFLSHTWTAYFLH